MNEEARRLRATIAHPRPTSSARTRIRGRRNATASSTAQTHSFGEVLRWEQEIIDRLQASEGVLGTELADLFEICSSCNRYFIASLLRSHIRSCMHDL